MELLIRAERAGPGGPDPAANVGLKCSSWLAGPVSLLSSLPGADFIKTVTLSVPQQSFWLAGPWILKSAGGNQTRQQESIKMASRPRLALGVGRLHYCAVLAATISVLEDAHELPVGGRWQEASV